MQISVTCAAGAAQAARPEMTQEAPEQATAGGPRKDRSVPPGMNWIGDRRDKTYYSATCERGLAIPPAERLYYPSEPSLRTAGFARGEGC